MRVDGADQSARLGAARTTDPLIGLELGGRYRVEQRVARGGMGSIYRGIHLELGRTVAIKVLEGSFARDEEAVRRFEREARTAGRLDHPNIVAIVDLGRLDDGAPYLVMELLEGEDLADLIAHEKALGPARVLEILAPIARALDAVHREGLLHRDIKPANIFLAKRPDGNAIPKLLDFGLAALRETPEHDRLTREGIVVGTPHYVSPEAAEGEAVDERSDVYSLGLVAFEMLAGVLPLEGDRPMSLLYAKVRRPAPTLSQRTGKRFPPALEELVARTLSRTPAKRPNSAGAFIEELSAIVEALPSNDATEVDLRTVSPRDRGFEPSELLKLPLERRRYVMAIGAIAFAALIGLGIWAFGSTQESVQNEPLVPAPSAPIDLDPAPALATRAEPTRDVQAPTPSAEPPSAIETRAAPRRAPSSAPSAEGARQSTPTRVAPAASTPRPTTELTPDPAEAAALSREGGLALVRGELPRARRLFREATYADARHAAAWRGLGLACERMGLRPEARAAYARYLELAPHASDAVSVRARLARLEDVQ